jgi:hypothetical protein
MAASKLTGQVPDANAPSGSVIQVVSVKDTSSYTTTSGTFASFLSLSITPSSSSSKILCHITVGEPDRSDGFGKIDIYRNSTSIFEVCDEFGRGINNGNESHHSGWGATVLDSPATTSSITYSLQFAIGAGGGATFRIGNGGDHSITLMEIAG